jgi:hypothetical protein
MSGNVYNLATCYVAHQTEIDRMVDILGESIEAVLGK